MSLLSYSFCAIKAKGRKFANKGHGAENLQKGCLFLLYYHFPMEDYRGLSSNDLTIS